jgi:DNA-binding transcriptional LysR family regulator
VELLLSDAARDMVEDRIDLTIRVGAVNEPDAVVRRIGSTSLVCVGSRRYFELKGTPKTPADLVDHNCLVYEGMVESTHWPFTGPEGPFNVPVRGNFSSNSVDAIRTGVLAGVGIGMFTRASLAEELAHPDVVTILNDFVMGTRDVSVVWPQRRFISARVHRVTDYFVQALSPRL